jgi:cyanate lyase
MVVLETQHYSYMEVHNMKIKEKIVNVKTGEETTFEREMTPEEIAQMEEAEAMAAAEIAEAQAKEAARQAVLDKLGLTADEVAALGL